MHLFARYKPQGCDAKNYETWPGKIRGPGPGPSFYLNTPNKLDTNVHRSMQNRRWKIESEASDMFSSAQGGSSRSSAGRVSLHPFLIDD
jgi:hypothetical protein